jgi:hypothetical protein
MSMHMHMYVYNTVAGLVHRHTMCQIFGVLLLCVVLCAGCI